LILHTVPSSVPSSGPQIASAKITQFFLPSYFVGRQVPRAQIFCVIRSPRKVKARLPTLRPSIRVWVPHLAMHRRRQLGWSVRAHKSACFRSQPFSVDRKWTALLRKRSRQDNNRKYQKSCRSFYLIIIRVVSYILRSRLHFNFYRAAFFFGGEISADVDLQGSSSDLLSLEKKTVFQSKFVKRLDQMADSLSIVYP
jgi:hypothetical protein